SFFLPLRSHSSSTLFPYTTLFRSYREQAAHGLLTDDVVKGVLAGVQQTLSKETADNNGEAALRLLTLLDLQVFLHAVPSDTTAIDRKSTRLNSSHVSISYAVFCLK